MFCICVKTAALSLIIELYILCFAADIFAAIMTAVQRNFGGHPENADAVLQSFFASLNLPQPDQSRLLRYAIPWP
jgi:hypothetical protein